jgi:hypothetical protein
MDHPARLRLEALPGLSPFPVKYSKSNYFNWLHVLPTGKAEISLSFQFRIIRQGILAFGNQDRGIKPP